MSDQPTLVTIKKMKQPAWLKRCSPPVRVRVQERIISDGYIDDPDQWITDTLATAVRSPQGYMLRFAGLRRAQAKELTQESLADVDFFSARGGARPVTKLKWRLRRTHERFY